jgi:dTDP-4-dehydrorhamnose reductase
MTGPILVTGGAGQVATALLAAAGARTLRRVGRPEFDFDRPDAIPGFLRETAPALVVNAAAYTAVDAAEADEAGAARANASGPGLIAAYCAEAGIPLIHISTDYVFDGLKGAPYVETDPTSPTGVYGRTKLAGEAAVLSACPTAMVLRTSWVYAPWGKNFVRTMLNAALKTNKLRVVADQVGCPTAATDLAAAILAISDLLARDGWKPEYHGVFHAGGTGSTSWHGLATAVFEEAARHGQERPTVDAIATADWPTPAKRPPDSRLDSGKITEVFGVRLPEWRPTLAVTVDTIFFDRGKASPAAAGV